MRHERRIEDHLLHTMEEIDATRLELKLLRRKLADTLGKVLRQRLKHDERRKRRGKR